MKHSLLILALFSSAAFAQHEHPAKIVGPVKDPQRGMVMPAPNPGESVDHAMDHALPVGNGGTDTDKYGAWLNPPVTGVYQFPQPSVLPDQRPVFMEQKKFGPIILVAGRAYRLWPWKGPLIWITPDGKQGPVPKEYILPVNPSQLRSPTYK